MKEIVIKLSDTEYNQLIYGDDGLDYEILEEAAVNGTVLPEHGRLIDADALFNEFCEIACEPYINAQTILEATGVSE